MPSAKPTLDLLRSLTEEQVLRALMGNGKLTRAEVATKTGISKPTISEGVRRLVDAGLVVDTGERSSGRGRAGSYYTLSPGCGAALIVSMAPAGVIAASVDAFGEVSARAHVELGGDATSDQAADALAKAAGEVRDATAGPLRIAVVSAADPVDRETGRLLQLPDAPFLVGELDPREVLSGLVRGEVLVDNDVNWEARAERAFGSLVDADNFVYLHLGEGLGCAVVCDGEVWRGHSGVAGEISHMMTVGPEGRAVRLTEVFAALGLRQSGSTAVDTARLRAAIDPSAGGVLTVLAAAVSGVLSATIALADPAIVVVGGSWGRDDAFVEALRNQFTQAPRHVPVSVSTVTDQPQFRGAQAAGLEILRTAIVNAVRSD